MMDWTDRHQRFFLRLISQHTLLYTEMVTTGALIFGDRTRFLQYNPEEHPVALQIGGSDPSDLAQCARFAEEYGYDEINLNVGCPSDRVQNGRIGACLMAEPQTVADGIKAMQDVVDIPVTVKHRIGINGRESFEELVEFVGTVANADCKTFIVHARIAVLEGLSPKQNRDVPPLKYDWVYQLKREFPDLEILINGGITTLDECEQHLLSTDGVMIGREAYHNPYLLAEVDRRFFGTNTTALNRFEIIEKLVPYIERQLTQGTHLQHITRHILGLFHHQPGAKRFRRHLSENAWKKGATVDTLITAVSLCDQQVTH